MSYNGWKNWETWNVALWFGNDEGLYHAARYERQSQGRFNKDKAARFVMELLPKGTPDFESPAEYLKVNWSEVSRSLNEL